MIDVVPNAGVIALGKQGENQAVRVTLPNIRAGAGSILLLHQRSDDQKPYPVPVVEADGGIIWTISSTDTAYPGRGQAELQWLGADGAVVKSVTYQTNTIRALTTPGAVPDEPLRPYTQAVARDAQAAKDAAASATEAVRSAEASAGQAGLSAENAAKSLKKLEDGIASGDFRGEKGEQGEKGEKGDPGPQGPQGEVGPAGDTTAADAAAEAAKKAAQEAQKAAETAVLYTEQHLTGSQQEQARTNISAADKARQNILVGTETGNPIAVDDAFAAPLCGLTVYGKSTQDGTPSPDNPVPIVSAGDGGSVAVKVTGKNLLDYLHDNPTKSGWSNSTYSIGAEIATLHAENGWCAFWWQNPTPGKQISVSLTYRQIDKLTVDTKSAFAIGTSNTKNYPSVAEYLYSTAAPSTSWNRINCSGASKQYLYIFLRVDKEGAGEQRTIEIKDFQLELGTTATAYEPYREQLLTLPTPTGLPGIPVTSGGNYTDPQGQRWVCDEVDLEKGVKIQNNGSAQVNTKNGYVGETYRLDVPINEEGKDGSFACIISVTPFVTWNSCVAKKNLYLKKIPKTDGSFYTGEELKALALDVDVIYQLAAPIETPLTPAELAAYKALTTYAPDTVVQASDGAGVKLDYQRDVNIAIKKLEDAIASMTTT